VAAETSHKRVNIRIGSALYRALETIAHQERRSLPQTARLLLEEGLRQRTGGALALDDTSGSDIATLAAAGGAFDWLNDEPDLYDDSCGEPI
jgi:hypothetical protein